MTVALVGAMGAAGTAFALPTTLSYNGVITLVNDPGPFLGPEVTLGADFTLSVSLDITSGNALNSQGLPEGVQFYAIPTGIVTTYSFGGAPTVQFSSSIAIANDFSGLDAWGTNSPGLGASPLTYVSLTYRDDTSTFLSDTGIFVPSGSDFSGWSDVSVVFSHYDGIPGITPTELARGTLSPAVPEPSTGLLLLAGLAVMSGRGFRRSF